MNFSNRETDISNISFTPTVEQSRAKTFMANVFLLMFIALGISALFAWLFSNNIELLTYLITATGGLTLLGKITMFAPLVFVLIMSFGYRKFSAAVLLALFI